jgi:hypothetical protein
MLRNSVIRSTGQTWKLAVAVLALVAGSIVPAFPAAGMSWTVGMIVAVAGYGFGLLLIRCPACRTRWFWDALMNPEVYKAVLAEPACPKCNEGADVSGGA